MAGKKRRSLVVDVNVKQSKTAKRSQGKKKEEGFIASADMDRIVPLGGGEYAYILDPRDGRTHHVRVGSSKWNSLIIDLISDERFGHRIQAQIAELGWRNTLGHPT